MPCALIGRPNAGKSTLFNALLGYDRAIVTPIPGTTRDTVEERITLGGTLLKLTDTAGLRDTADPVERLGVERSRAAADGAELVLALVDGSAPMTAEDREVLARAARCGKWIAVFTKRDLGGPGPEQPLLGPEGQALTPSAVVWLSATGGEGLDELEAAVAALFPADSGARPGALLTTAFQADCARRAREAVDRAAAALTAGLSPDAVLTDVEDALEILGELTGRTVREDVTARIFERFCVGK